jgi:hypothetical protein
VKKSISIGVALALLAMAVLPGFVAAQTPPDTYAKTPFAIIAEGLRLVGTLLDMEEAKFGFIGYDVGQFMDPIADFTAGPLSWTVDMLAWGVNVLGVVLDPIITNFASSYSWIVDVVNDLTCQILAPWGSITCP